MSYGAAAYGATAYGATSGSEYQTFFPFLLMEPDVLHEATAIAPQMEEFYEVITRQSNEDAGVLYSVYTSQGQGDTPQLQATVGGNGQTIVGNAPFITVTVMIDGAVFSGGMPLSVIGRPYNQERG